MSCSVAVIRFREDRTKEFRKYYQESIQPILDDKLDTFVQLGCENEEGTVFIVFRVFPNADVLDQQVQVADERSKKTYEYIELSTIEIFSTPNAATLEKMKKIAGSGKYQPRLLGWFYSANQNDKKRSRQWLYSLNHHK